VRIPRCLRDLQVERKVCFVTFPLNVFSTALICFFVNGVNSFPAARWQGVQKMSWRRQRIVTQELARTGNPGLRAILVSMDRSRSQTKS